LRMRSRACRSRQWRSTCRVALRTTRNAPTPPRHHASVCEQQRQQQAGHTVNA
jgi:hypothetical protein